MQNSLPTMVRVEGNLKQINWPLFAA